MAEAVDDRGIEPPSTNNPVDWARWLGPAGGIALAIVLIEYWYGDSIREYIDASAAYLRHVVDISKTVKITVGGP